MGIAASVLENTVRFAFQPLYSLHSGGVVALEALAAETVKQEAEQHTLLPLHINLTAPSLAAPKHEFEPLLDALLTAGRRTREVVLEIGPPFSYLRGDKALAGMQRLGELGFRLALDGLGQGNLPLGLLSTAPVDLLKLDRSVLRRLPDDPSAIAVVEALLHFTSRTHTRLVATGIETEEQLDAAGKLGVRIAAQGHLFASAGPELELAGLTGSAMPEPDQRLAPGPHTAPRVRDFLRPASTLPSTATCEDVRAVLAAADGPSGIVGVDEHYRPQWSINRTRFLLAVTGPYGHALHAKRGAERLADAPHTIHAEASALEFLELVTDADWSRTDDDVIVVDSTGRFPAVVLVTEVVRGVAEVKVEEAAALSPLTRLPGSDTVARDVDRRIAQFEPFVAAWLDVDSFKTVSDTMGFAAGDDLIRALGRTLTELASRMRWMTVSHVGDDFLVACDVDEIGTVAGTLLDTPSSAEGMSVTVSLATLVCGSRTIGSYREVSRLLAPLKKRAKAVPGSSWVPGRPGAERIEVLRGIGKQRDRSSSLIRPA